MAYKKKRVMKRKRTTNYKKKGLTKTERTQVKTIAKRVTNSLAETKYFNVSRGLGELPFHHAWENAGSFSEIAVLGFTTGYEKSNTGDGQASRAFKYGVNSSGNQINMDSLELNRIFTDTDTIPDGAAVKQNAIEGQTVRPSFCQTKWLLNRLAGGIDTLPTVQNGLAYKIRMIRCKPRVTKGSHQRVDPIQDLFVDQANNEFGITTTQGGINLWNGFEFMLAKPNTRKYQILEDTIFTMGSGGNYTNLGSAEDLLKPYQVQQAESSACKVLTRTHDIGKEFYYSDPNDTVDPLSQYPSDGFVPEFILFHVWASGNPEETFTLRETPSLLRLSCRPVSAFKDM